MQTIPYFRLRCQNNSPSQFKTKQLQAVRNAHSRLAYLKGGEGKTLIGFSYKYCSQSGSSWHDVLPVKVEETLTWEKGVKYYYPRAAAMLPDGTKTLPWYENCVSYSHP